jgi:hypothetical protein
MNDPIYASQVNTGALLLDEQRPGWARSVNLSRFDMASLTDCLLGQLFGGFAAGVIMLWNGDALSNKNWKRAIAHGFIHPDDHRDAELTPYWRAAILQRL